ncbi:S8/S53 family peptidase [Deinococcus radiotolerans]|uniref:Peptidase S8/S53 domain-containing protein n=1 Tax=Deinococcus radiotolerans TaxID=1309407 RepID=A0ABQ2FNI7_9DEIO|nr:S8/S53 family peptidase [Deinococcus radiotolerans]GGL11404.1 hypothetical protein GCM10010844_32620 [Deinococcus radiotolerans]
MNRALTAFLIALLLSVARAAIPVEEIYPSQIAPGGLLQVKISDPPNETCTGGTTSLSVWIGSHAYPVACEDHTDYWFLIMTLPEDPGQLPQMGPQVLSVLQSGERPSEAGPLKRNIQILDRITGVLSVQTSPPSSGDQYSFRPEALATLFTKPVRQRDSVALTQAREAVVRELNSEGVTLIETAKIPGEVGICGLTIYHSQLRSEVLQRQVGILIDQAELLAEDANIMVAPDTARQPPADSTYWSDAAPDLLNAYAWNSIHLNARTNTVKDPATVYLIDTYHPDLNPADPFTTQLTFNNHTFASTGHGSRVAELIRLVAPGAGLKFTQACNEAGVCSLVQVLRGLCDASHQAIDDPHSVIVHLSLATPYDHPILREGINAAVATGAALVFAYGNSDRCLGRTGGPLDYCNAYPADWAVDPVSGGAMYSVGASQQSNPTPQTFQRGQPRRTWNGATRNGQKVTVLVQPAMPVATDPSLTAPGFFFLPLTAQGRAASDARPYWGTSFAAPLVTGALVRWVQAGKTRWPAPTELQCSHLRLDLRRISNSC